MNRNFNWQQWGKGTVERFGLRKKEAWLDTVYSLIPQLSTKANILLGTQDEKESLSLGEAAEERNVQLWEGPGRAGMTATGKLAMISLPSAAHLISTGWNIPSYPSCLATFFCQHQRCLLWGNWVLLWEWSNKMLGYACLCSSNAFKNTLPIKIFHQALTCDSCTPEAFVAQYFAKDTWNSCWMDEWITGSQEMLNKWAHGIET